MYSKSDTGEEERAHNLSDHGEHATTAFCGRGIDPNYLQDTRDIIGKPT